MHVNEPVVGAKRPAGHSEQAVWPAKVVLNPARQAVQLEAPVEEVAVPGAQGLHAAAPAAANVPGRHAVTAVEAAVGQ